MFRQLSFLTVKFLTVDFAKAYDSVRWDYLDDVLNAFGFGVSTMEVLDLRGPLAPFFVHSYSMAVSFIFLFNPCCLKEAGMSIINLKKSYSRIGDSNGSMFLKRACGVLDVGVKIRLITWELWIGNGLHTRFWKDSWLVFALYSGLFPRLFALDTEKDISVAGKLQSPLVSSFRRNVRGGIEEQQLEHLVALLDYVILSNSNDRWVSDFKWDGGLWC
ncbi:hypothetical protein Tco_0631698 [Tanacetum coccineum]